MIVKYNISKIPSEPIWELEEVKNYIRVTHDYDDSMISNLIESATDSAELFTGIHLSPKEIICTVRKADKMIILKYPPKSDLKTISLIKNDGKEDITEDFGIFNSDFLSISLSKQYWGKNIEIRYEIDYQEQIPSAIKQAILIHVSYMYESNESVFLPESVKDLYLPYRYFKLDKRAS